MEIPTTQRAYTLRVSGRDKNDHGWRNWLWRTHEAVNKGAKVFGDWLLTLRGGIDHSLADVKDESERTNRRIVLALSWLSVESQNGAPPKRFHVSADGTTDALAEILRLRKVSKPEIESWQRDCRASLTAATRLDAVWVNRSALFDEAAREIGKSLTRDEVWDLFDRFFGSRDAYFEGLATADEDDEEGGGAEEERAKDLAQKARGWLSNRFGSGSGADFSAIADEYDGFAKWCRWFHEHPKESIETSAKQLRKALRIDELPERLASTPGPPNRVQTTYQAIVAAISDGKRLPKEEYAELAEIADSQAEAKRKLVGRKDSKPWANKILDDVIEACRIPYRDTAAEADLINEYSVILDHAARRICMAHSWIKLAEANRQEFTKDARKLDELREYAPAAVSQLDNLCDERTKVTGAIEDYRIRRGAITDWERVVKSWSRKKCVTSADRIAAAREVQAEPENEKPGDIQLYELLAAENYLSVWKQGDKATHKTLQDYVAATDAQAKQRRFKVPAYRHPDPLLHPVFCDFGESRWSVDYSAHRAPAGRNNAHALLAKRTADLAKAREAMFKAKNAELRQKAQEKVSKLESAAAQALDDTQFMELRHGLRIKLFDGSCVDERDLVWHSKRLDSDLALRSDSSPGDELPIAVSRADRLGRAAAGANADAAVAVADLFKLKEWNGRLQAPRAQLNAIAAVRDRKRNKDLSMGDRKARVERMISRLQWLVTFSAKLQPQGPWLTFCQRLPEGFNYDPKKRRLYHKANKNRKGRAQIILARIPGLRVLSVDLGHRFAAGCAVWETLSSGDMKRACNEAGVPVPSTDDLHKVIKRDKRRTIYRRIAADRLPDGTPHPGPWVRLDRQFLIKLQGEESAARLGSPAEIAAVDRLEAELGYSRARPRTKAESSVDLLMAEAVRLVRLGIGRLKRRMRIAHQLTARQVAGMAQKKVKLDDAGRREVLTKTLRDWHDLATSRDWRDEFAVRTWQTHILPLVAGAELPEVPQLETGAARKKRLTAAEERLAPVAERLVARDVTTMREEWAHFVRAEKQLWQKRLRWLRDWLLPRKGRRNAASIRRVGGLSVLRIATLKELYQVQKAYRMLGDPDDPTKGIPQRGDDSLDRFGQRVLTAMERLRENRVKQLASRVIEAALGFGREPGSTGNKQNARSQSQTHEPCHAVVIENLKNYRPDESMTRRETRQLMAWASATVAKYLDEGCQLYGLYIRQVPAAYTSRQDSRTAAPGTRCQDVSVERFLRPHWAVVRSVNDLLPDAESAGMDFQERVTAAEKLVRSGKGNAEQRFLVELYQHSRKLPEQKRRGRSVRIPQRGGELFVSADRRSPIARGIQADLNAAANIGLKALLDPDWAGAWWYVPVDDRTYKPVEKSVAGSAALSISQALSEPPQRGDDEKERNKKKPSTRRGSSGDPQEIINLWRFVSAKELPKDKWFDYQQFQNIVRKSVIDILRAQAGIPEDRVGTQ